MGINLLFFDNESFASSFYFRKLIFDYNGRLYGRLEMFGFETQLQAVAENISEDLIRSSEIEGVSLNTDEVRSSVARGLHK